MAMPTKTCRACGLLNDHYTKDCPAAQEIELDAADHAEVHLEIAGRLHELFGAPKYGMTMDHRSPAWRSQIRWWYRMRRREGMSVETARAWAMRDEDVLESKGLF